MKQKSSLIHAFLLIFVLASFLSGCSDRQTKNPPKPDTKRITNTSFEMPEASGAALYENDLVSIDASNTSDGYFMLKYSGTSSDAKHQITLPDETVYTYSLAVGSYETIPLTGTDGNYHIDVLEHVSDGMYALVFSQNFEVSLNDEFTPYLYPNQYVWYTPDSEVVSFGVSLSDQSTGDLDYLEQVYLYVIQNIVYDTELAENIPLNYIPEIDRVLAEKKGICFDYASLMTALLRSQKIPTKLVVGYSGTAYHAWISVYLKETGWVDNIIQFDGEHWSLMDPTLAASNDNSSVEKYIGDGSNYLAKYYY